MIQPLVVAVLLALACALPTRAMEFSPFRIDSGLVVIKAFGEIAPGDSDRLMSVLVLLPTKEAHVLALNSPGGSVVAGQSLATMIKQTGLGVYVSDSATCASACFLLYAAGRSKFYSPGARVGIHSASGPDYETPASMAMTTVAARTMSDMGVPDAIVGRMIRTPPGSMAWLSEAELVSMGAINLDRLNSSPPPVAAAPPTPAPTYRPPASPAPVVALAQPLRPGSESADPLSGSFQHGLADRTTWERWFNGLSGDYRSGAEFWTGERSKPRPASCNTPVADFMRGCLEAKRLLTGVDIARKSDRQYWWGWNSYAKPDDWAAVGSPVAAPAAPLSFDDLIPRGR